MSIFFLYFILLNLIFFPQDLDFWLGEVEALLTTDELGKDLASVQNLMKKHQLVEADIIAHEDRINDMNEQADSLVDTGTV